MSNSARCILLLSVVAVLVPVTAPARTPFLVRDLHQEASNGDGVSGFESAVFQGRLFYVAYDPRFGSEPWTSDGTPEGTRLFRDLCPGPCSSLPIDYTVVGQRLFFSADDGAAGREPWTSDGTPEGTYLLRDTIPGTAGSENYASRYAAAGETLFFATQYGQELSLWTSDGTRDGTVSLITCGDCRHGELHGGTDERLYVMLYRGFESSALWTSDGTAAGTRQLIRGCRKCEVMGTLGDLLVFRRGDGPLGVETWVSDGTPEGTRLLVDSCPGGCAGAPLDYLKADGVAYFTGVDGEQPLSSRGLWASDGTPEGTRLALAGSRGTLAGVFGAVAWNDRIYFSSPDPGSVQSRLFSYDPADGRLRPVRDGFSGIGSLMATGDHLFFLDTASGGSRLWASDGTRRGTRAVTPSISYGPLNESGFRNLSPGDAQLFFTAFSPTEGWELWSSDGTPVGSRRLADAGTDPGSSAPRRLTALDGQVLFVAGLENGTTSVFRTDGTAQGTLPLDTGPSGPREFGRFDSKLIYSGSTVEYRVDNDLGVWISNGTASGTKRLRGNTFDATGFTQAGGQVFFAASVPGIEVGEELWASDGTRGGTRLVLDVNPGIQPAHTLPCCANSSRPHEITALGSEVLFAAADADFGNNVELWKSDGTAEGTVKVAEICPNPPEDPFGAEPSGSRPSDLTLWNDRVFFAADDGRNGRELWVSDGTTEGTERVTDLGRTADGSSPHGLFVLDGKLYFFARRGRAESLWSTDGTPEGTERVHSLAYRRRVSRAISRRVVGHRVFFVVDNERLGPELWVSDGTREGTRLVVDLRPGPSGSHPDSLTPLGDRVIFAADDGESGREVWVSDGTARGTRLLADVSAGPDASNPADFVVEGALLYFSAATPAYGRELWAVEHGQP